LGTTVATFLAIAGASVWMEATGEGPAIVFIHAGIADSRMWDAEAESLQATHRVVRLDLRGFGRSAHVPGKFSYHGDVLAVLDSLRLERATVVGCSFGSRVALDLAVAHPERVDRLILVSPSVGDGDQSEVIRAYHEAAEAALDSGDLDEAVEVNLRMWVDGPHRGPGDVDPELRRFVGEMQRLALEAPLPEGISLDRLDPPARDRLADVKPRTLVVAGTLDVDHTQSVARRVAKEIPNARLEMIEGAAHLPSLEKPGEWIGLLKGFLAEN